MTQETIFQHLHDAVYRDPRFYTERTWFDLIKHGGLGTALLALAATALLGWVIVMIIRRGTKRQYHWFFWIAQLPLFLGVYATVDGLTETLNVFKTPGLDYPSVTDLICENVLPLLVGVALTLGFWAIGGVGLLWRSTKTEPSPRGNAAAPPAST